MRVQIQTWLVFKISMLALWFACCSVIHVQGQQKDDSLAVRIKHATAGAFYKNFAFRHNQCRDTRLTVSSIFVSFSKAGKVESILFSVTPECLNVQKEKIIAQLRTEIDKLNIPKREIANYFILVTVAIAAKERKADAGQELPDNWSEFFAGIDSTMLKGKSLKYVIPIEIIIYPPVH